jgi:hypothetical protein
MAMRGEIPGAAKPRGIWTFDLVRLEKFNRDHEAAICQNARHQKAVSGGMACSTGAFRPGAATSNGRYAQTIQALRKLAAQRSASAR